MKEFELIELLTRGLPSNEAVVVGSGDDCAVLDLGRPGEYVLFKTDAVVEGIHFSTDEDPRKVGHKALARCLSDVAAMAGKPVAALVTLGLPAKADPGRLEQLYAGMKELAARWQTAIVGGEMTTNPERLLLSISLLGIVSKERCILRSGARGGDAIFVTGELGGSGAGRHLDFEPRLAEAAWLSEQFKPHCMIDLSDGLAGDLRHILTASGVGAELLASAIPISGAARLEARDSSSAKPPLLAALTDGEDFELLFTVVGGEAVRLLDAWKTRFPELRLSCIGKILEKPGLSIRDQQGVRPLEAHGYVHFS